MTMRNIMFSWSQKTILERKSYPAFDIIIEVNTRNSWMIHEDVPRSVDLFLRNTFSFGQLRQFYLADKVKIQVANSSNSKVSLFLSGKLRTNREFVFQSKNWFSKNRLQSETFFQFNQEELVIYPYSLPNAVIQEVLFQMGIKFSLTNEISKASLIIGLKKHLKQNFQLIQLAQETNIPIYSLNYLSFYQLNKLIRFFYT